MWRSHLFWKLLLAYGAILLATAGAYAWLLSNWQLEQLTTDVRDRLHAEAALLRSQVAADLERGDAQRLRDLTRDWVRQTDARLTLIALNGSVLADSEQDPGQMEPHNDRPEVLQARAEGLGIRVDRSRTLGIPMTYLALRVDRADGAPVGFVRVAMPWKVVQSRAARRQWLLWGIVFVAAAAICATTRWLVARIVRPARSLARAADAIARGEHGPSVYEPSRDELGELAAAFDRMSTEIATRVSQLRGDQELLATVLGGMIEGVVAVDADERILFANGAARELLGWEDTSVAGRPIWELIRLGTVQQALRDAFGSERACRREIELPGPARRVVALHASRLPGDPPPGVVLVFHDVTELRRLETMRRDFVANVSHELKTPLSSIRAYTETLLSGALDDSEHRVQFVRQIEEQSARLQTLILDLLSLARIESGQEAFEIVPLAIAGIVQSCVARHQASAAAKGVVLEIATHDDSVHVLADAEGMREILDNLIDNAVKYTPHGGRVAIHWSHNGDIGTIAVSDTGIGIAPRDQSRIFERFYRVDKARSRELGGTGLGLAIVKHLTQSFRGTIDVASEVGAGSTFTVRLPLG